MQEFQKIASCFYVPTENDGEEGTRCVHWDEECLRNEIMTGQIPPAGQKAILSRITIGALHDLGYSVNYKAAEPYGRADVNPACVCKIARLTPRRRRTVEEMDHGEAFSFLRGNGDAVESNTVPKEGPTSLSSRKVIGDEAHALAMAEGRRLLQKAAPSYDKGNGENDGGDDVVYVGDQMVTVFVQEGPHIFGVVVRKEQL
jgi:Leishmanolysin